MKVPFLILTFFILIRSAIFSQGWPVYYPQWDGSVQAGIFETYDKGYCMLIWDYKYPIIAKVDINGNILWCKKLGNGTIGFGLGNIDKTSDGGIIYCAGFDKYDPTGTSDPIIIKFNACGDIDWCSVINTPNSLDYSCKARELSDGNYILLVLRAEEPVNRIQLFKLNSSGNLIWKKNYPGTGYVFSDDADDILALNDGYLITGNGYADDSIHPGLFAERPYFIRTDTAGNILWRLVYGVNSGFTGLTGYYSTIISNTGCYYCVGWNSTYCDTPALMKVLSDGNEGYHQDLVPGACPGGCSAMSLYDDTTFVVYGGGTVNGSMLAKWMKIDTFGIETLAKIFSEDWMHSSGHNVVTFDKKIVCLSDYEQNIRLYKLNQQFDFDSSYTRPFTYDSLCSHPIVSDTINPDCGLIVSVPDIKKNPEAFRMKVYPNPASTVVTIDLPSTLLVEKNQSAQYFQWDKTVLMIYNFDGKQIFNQEIPFSQKTLNVHITNWERGMYYFQLNYRENNVTGEKVLIK